MGLAAFRLIFEEAEEKNNVHKGKLLGDWRITPS
jgi:hypothetical protein